LRELQNAASKGNPRALLSIHIFSYRIRKYIGAYVAALGGLDALVFTGGIGEGSSWVRGLVCQGLSYMGIMIDSLLNKTNSPGAGEVAEISDERSHVKILIIPTDEGRMIARETIRILDYQKTDQVIKKRKESKVPLEVCICPEKRLIYCLEQDMN
jgi:acetate kinase